jgi:UDP-N-acetylglucosamine 2-epimerase (non-hydrolysing)
MTIRTLCVFGTRPEAIKMAPLIKHLNAYPRIDNHVCVTGQHEKMLDSVLHVFNITPESNLHVMAPDQDLSQLTAKMLVGLRDIMIKHKPHLVLVHGDTTTALTTALSAYYHHVPIGHVEAGLRTGNLMLPWPEEANRKLVGGLATLHFAPTESARANLLREGVSSGSIHVTGNTVIDALHDALKKLQSEPTLMNELRQQFSFLSSMRKMILITGHRRESFGEGFLHICQALKRIACLYPDVDLVYPVHLNPRVQEPVKQILSAIPNVYLIDPVDYLPFVYLMKMSHLILTDSGGIQEEAPSLGKPVLVMREKTERPEALAAGTVRLVGTDADSIVQHVEELLNNSELYQQMSYAQNPYGDGKASERIVQAIIEQFNLDIQLKQREALID